MMIFNLNLHVLGRVKREVGVMISPNSFSYFFFFFGGGGAGGIIPFNLEEPQIAEILRILQTEM